MEWAYVARWIKKPDNENEIKSAAQAVRNHWEEVALDVGFDPARNVTVMEGEKELRVAISEEMDMAFREGGGSWQYY